MRVMVFVVDLPPFGYTPSAASQQLSAAERITGISPAVEPISSPTWLTKCPTTRRRFVSLPPVSACRWCQTSAFASCPMARHWLIPPTQCVGRLHGPIASRAVSGQQSGQSPTLCTNSPSRWASIEAIDCNDRSKLSVDQVGIFETKSAMGPPPGGPWCSAPPDTNSSVCPTTPPMTPPTRARA